jgi:hypothetical protein
MNFTQKVLIAFSFVAIFIIGGSNVMAQSDQVNRQLRDIQNILGDRYTRSHQIEYDDLRNGENETYTLSLDSGNSYKIIAVCDGDCGDLDLVLRDNNRNLIDSDIEADDRPIVSVTPRYTGRFRLEVRMANCKVNPCRFGIVIYKED